MNDTDRSLIGPQIWRNRNQLQNENRYEDMKDVEQNVEVNTSDDDSVTYLGNANDVFSAEEKVFYSTIGWMERSPSLERQDGEIILPSASEFEMYQSIIY